MVRTNQFIINKKAYGFTEMRVAGTTAIFLNESGRPVDYGVIPLDGSVYALLSCPEFRILMLVSDRQGVRTVYGAVWRDEEGFERGVEALRKASGARVSKQDLKISNYAWQIASKLDAGVRIKVADAVDTSEMEVCPECGMLNPKGTPYCLECGAEI